MDAEKIKKLEAAGWKIGSAYEFLRLNRQEAEYIESELKRAGSEKCSTAEAAVRKVGFAYLTRSSSSASS